MKTAKICNLYLVRHGETDWNAKRIVLGQRNEPKLTGEGIRQAKKIGQALSRVKLAAVYASDLDRALKTTRLIIGGRNLEIKTYSDLRERNYGKFEGRQADEYEKATTAKFKQREKLSGMTRMKFRLGKGIESDYEIFKRFSKRLKQIAKKHLGENVLIVTHGGCIRTFLVGNNLARHHQLPKDKLLFGDYLEVVFDGSAFRIG